MFRYICGYNGGMEKDKYSPYSQCCGRPMHYAPQPKCNYNDCCLEEYKYSMPACIRNKQPDCEAKAVIPSVTVGTTEGLTNLANCFVHVTGINTTFYVDDKHRPMIVWAGPVEIVNYDIETNELNLRSQFCLTTVGDIYTEVYFDKQGVGHIIGQEA